MKSLAKRLDDIEPLLMAQAGKLEKTVYGIVDMNLNVIRRWKGVIGDMVSTDEEPTIILIEKLEPFILKHRKYKLLYGGRAGTKSIFGMDVMIGEVNSTACGVFCLREQMKSLSQSIYRGITKRINALNFAGFTPLDSKWQINSGNGGIISFGGMRNIEDMKSLFDYKFFLLEEAANTSQETIDILGPTLRGVDGAELIYMWNPKSSGDPMSKEFIIPFQDDLDRCGYYEDDYHMVIKLGFEDNPWFQQDESLRDEYNKDKEKMEQGRMSKARFNHIWHGAFNDDVENCLIEQDWFDACIDAHKVLGFKPVGRKIATHDPADIGDDKKTVGIRHGVVWTYLEEIDAPNGNDACDIACDIALYHRADMFGYDGDGMGALLRNQVAAKFNGTHVQTYMFKGSHGVDKAEAVFTNGEAYNLNRSAKNKDVLKNKRAQNYVKLAARIYKTYTAVVHGDYVDPDQMISFSSELKCIQKLRSELCRLPIKPVSSGRIELYSKEEMRKGIMMPDGSKLKIPSPNLADVCMMAEDDFASIVKPQNKHRPKARIPMGIRR